MILAKAMVWTHMIMKFGSAKRWSGLRQYGLLEVTQGSEEEQDGELPLDHH